MAVDTQVVFDGHRRYVVHLQNQEDDTNDESNVTKVDISTLTNANGETATYTVIDKIEYSIGSFGHVFLSWDHTTDDLIATLSGQGSIDWTAVGGKVDPRSAGGTGDILLTTVGAAVGASYDITIWLRPKA